MRPFAYLPHFHHRIATGAREAARDAVGIGDDNKKDTRNGFDRAETVMLLCSIALVATPASATTLNKAPEFSDIAPLIWRL